MAIQFFKFQIKNIYIRNFWSQILAFLFLHKILQLGKFERADFNHDNNLLRFQPKNTQIRQFWSQIQEFLFLHETLQLDYFDGVDFIDDNSFLKF